MKLDRPVIVLLAVVIYFFPPVLRADSISSSTYDATKKVNTCNLYESDSNGNTSENGSQALGKNFLTGWLVITEGKGSNTDPKNWSDLALISSSTTTQVIYDLGSEGFKFPITVNGVKAAAGDVVSGHYNKMKLQNATIYMPEVGPPTVFMPKNMFGNMDTISLYSDTKEVPKPMGLGLIGAGLLLCVPMLKT